MLLLEFTIEPFHEGNPGSHVRAAVEAIEALGISVEVGPFGSSCVVAAHRVGAVAEALTQAAIHHGATHVNLHVERLDGDT